MNRRTRALPLRRAQDFAVSRWRSEVLPARIFWHDMVLVGTALNLLASFVAFALAAKGASAQWAALVFFLPLPYNLFLFASLWRHPAATPLLRAAATFWLVAATLL